ncbi:unnamed protein product, partial [Trichobilharzia szidati]
MLAILLLILFPLKCSSIYKDFCFFRGDEGDGYETLEKYYYNATIGKCVNFTYSGSGGNKNNFDTEKICKIACQLSGTFDRRSCGMDPVRGVCPRSYIRWYYDINDGICRQFGFWGCDKKNGNDFLSENECEAKCGSP